ncbi:MAG: flagellar motor protein MotD [Gammaproteobacteria bacterium]|nr:flagellar motor protein MotD [Gammaproteobacteria bacterium]
MIRKRKKAEEDQHQDRWMVSYADFVTLLFAFFVVMYSISSVNEGKYRVLSDSLTTAFNVDARSLEPIQTGEIRRGSGPAPVQLIRPAITDRAGFPAADAKKRVGEIEDAGDKPMKVLFEGLRASVATLSDKDLIKVHNNEFGVEIEISTSVLFTSGKTILADDALPVLTKLANVLKPFPHDINVQGYTDNIPVQGGAYPSNWELSAARAASVVKLFARLGIQEKRLSATGFGEFRPVGDNNTIEGRLKNRRVIVFVPSYKDKEAVLEAVSRLGDELDRGIVLDQSVTGNQSEDLKTNVKETAPGIIDVPLNETRFYNPEPDAGALPDQAESVTTAVGDQQAIGAGNDVRHIGNEPVDGVQLAPRVTNPSVDIPLEQR